jgi:hypothetical protein
MSRDFKNPEGYSPWQPVPALGEGAAEILLYRDESSGTYSRMLRLPLGFPGSGKVLVHDFDEVVYIVEGGVVDCTTGKPYGPKSVAVFPAGQEHGPLAAPVGALFIEFRHYRQQPSK